MARRKAIVEPVLSQIKQARGCRQLLLRGLDRVAQEWTLIRLAHNLLKVYGAGQRREPAITEPRSLPGPTQRDRNAARVSRQKNRLSAIRRASQDHARPPEEERSDCTSRSPSTGTVS